MKTGIKYTIRTMFYSSIFLGLVVIPQAIAQAFNTPITY